MNLFNTKVKKNSQIECKYSLKRCATGLLMSPRLIALRCSHIRVFNSFDVSLTYNIPHGQRSINDITGIAGDDIFINMFLPVLGCGKYFNLLVY